MNSSSRKSSETEPMLLILPTAALVKDLERIWEQYRFLNTNPRALVQDAFFTPECDPYSNPLENVNPLANRLLREFEASIDDSHSEFSLVAYQHHVASILMLSEMLMLEVEQLRTQLKVPAGRWRPDSVKRWLGRDLILAIEGRTRK